MSSLYPACRRGRARLIRRPVSNHTANCTQASLSVPLSFRAQRSGAEESRLISSPLPVLLLSTLTSLRSLLPQPVRGEPGRSSSEARRACPEPVEGNHPMQHPSPPHPGVRACPEPAERGRDPAAPNNPAASRHPVRHAALALDPLHLHPPPPIRDAPPFVVSRPGVFRRVVSNHTLSYTSQALLGSLLRPFSQLTTLSSLLPHPVRGEPGRSPSEARRACPELVEGNHPMQHPNPPRDPLLP